MICDIVKFIEQEKHTVVILTDIGIFLTYNVIYINQVTLISYT